MFERIKALADADEALQVEEGGLNLSWQNKTLCKPTSIFESMSHPYSDGGSYALYSCGHCNREMYGGQAVRRLPDGARVVQCPHCGCVDKSWREKFEKFGLVKEK